MPGAPTDALSSDTDAQDLPAEGIDVAGTGQPSSPNGDEAGKSPSGGATPKGEGTTPGGGPQSTSNLRNRTPDRLIIKADSTTLVLAPLEARALPETSNQIQVNDLISRGLVGWEARPADKDISWIFGGVIYAGIAAFWATLFVSEDRPWLVPWVLGAVAVGYALFALVALWILAKGSEEVKRQFAQFLMLMLVVFVSLGLPIITAFFFAEERIPPTEPSLSLLGRAIQVGFISIACMIPGLLYFLFDRQRLSTLRDRFEQQIFRLDPNVQTLSDVYTRYGRQVEEIYGQRRGSGESRLVRQTRWPILLATVTLAFGWIIALMPVGSAGAVETAGDINRLFTPQENAVSFGFLGAYFFAINLVFRRYARGDLRPKAYSTITVRVIVAVILGWLIQLIQPQPIAMALLFAFFVGIVPETFLTFLQEAYRGRQVARIASRLEEKLPLHLLEGIDLYDRARLLDEGVANIEGLAHHDLIDLLLETRIPAARLVDWVDQAILFLHVSDQESSNNNGNDETLVALRQLGIRTATDLENAHRLAKNNDYLDTLRAAVTTNDPAQGNGTAASSSRLDFLVDSLKDDEWMDYVRSWRQRSMLCEREIWLNDNGKVVAERREAVSRPNAVNSNAETAGAL